MQRTLVFFILLFLSIQTGAISVFGEHRIASDGKALVTLVVPNGATAVEQTAAKELKEHLDLVTGASFSIVKEDQYRSKSGGPAIWLGLSETVKTKVPDVDFSKIGYDGIVIRSVGKDLVLAGHPKRGTLYAVYSLLEETVGVRWWSDRERFIPKCPELVLPEQKVVYVPQLLSREAHYRIAFDGVFSARCRQNNSSRTRMNGNRAVIAPEFGDNDHFIFYKGRGSILHSFFELLPPSIYFEKHPDWYSEIKGKRTAKNSQLCLTNEEMRREFVKNAKELLRADPTAKFISITQNDWDGPCTCSKCRAIDLANGDAHSGTIITFVNAVAEEIEKEFPDVFIETLAYTYGRKAPTKVRPRDNVVVRLCSIECAFLKPLEEDPRNSDFVRDVRQWSQIADRLFIWNYVTTFHSYMIPHPNMRGLAPDIRFFIRNNAVGLFEQGDAFCTAGDFVRFRNWYLSRLMWNPNLDEKKLREEFFYGYYGREVGAILLEYLHLIHDRAWKVNINLRCFFTKVTDWMDLPTFNRSVELFDRAEKVAQRLEKEKPTEFSGLVHKVQRERIPIEHVGLLYRGHWLEESKKLGIPANLPSDPEIAARKLVAFWKIMNVETWREFTTLHQFNQYCDRLIADAVKQKQTEQKKK